MTATSASTPHSSLPSALTAFVPPRATSNLDLDVMAAIAVDAGRLAANDAVRAPMMSPAYRDAVVSLPVGAPARGAAARLFAACYDAALDPATD
ncbi:MULTISPECIES: hypothetical protein [unclassified Knoellia]|uniref:hypothetical protein n=1 Tax=Knoellia altitudinis TaxID=3404795 RepID=UPI00360F33E3